MSRIRPSWTPEFSSADGDFTLGHQWSASESITVEGAWYYRPTGASPPTALTAILYNAGTEAVLASGTASNPAEGWTFVPFTVEYVASSGVNYITAVQTNGRYGYSLNQLGSPITDPDHGIVTIPVNGARYEFGHVFPPNTGDFMHGADTDFTVDTGPSEGAGSFGIGLALDAQGSRVSAGSGAFGIGLALAAVGSRPSQGQAHFQLGFNLRAVSHQIAHPDRTYIVEVDARELIVEADSRVLVVEAEERIVHVE